MSDIILKAGIRHWYIVCVCHFMSAVIFLKGNYQPVDNFFFLVFISFITSVTVEN